MSRLRLPTAALGLLIATSAQADLRTFDVDPQYQQEVFAALSDILTPDPDRGLLMAASGRVELLPSGQILVNASAATLEQVEQVLQSIGSRAATAAPRAALRYWAILGARAAPADIGASPPVMLTGVLDELERLHEDLTFRVLGSAALTTASGQFGEIKGTTLSVEQLAHVQGDTLNAEISMKLEAAAPAPMIGIMDLGELTLRATLERGEFVVLGESEVRRPNLAGPVFYIVQWER